MPSVQHRSVWLLSSGQLTAILDIIFNRLLTMVPCEILLFTFLVSKGKKHAVLDEDDEELEAELRELEREKRELEALERGESLEDGKGSSEVSSAASASQFEALYDNIYTHTSPSTPQHQLPRHTAIFHLTKAVSTKDQAERLPEIVKQWRNRSLPLSIFVTDKLIHAICKAEAPETALELLGDRETYGLSPGQTTMRRVIRSFVKEIAAAGAESDEALEKLDGAFKTMALIPYYNLAADDASVYANLVRGSLLYGGEEGLRRATVSMDEYLLIDGEREKPLTRKRAAEMVAAAENLLNAYVAKGDTAKAQELRKHVATWMKSL
ncbi:hypothetical protein BC939DRAFT_153890 [Gamsiella multidivaricata]|uniref:uncharacterized protein n=1 Tax=Gamsiella multidivaricata TaxID=101098 RepID=UPI002220BF8E|nr:uncharacterized protein BC939DRAFT_153890 [Gamsiella multidivaricata]KAI7824116.1 hypothetical protein BC939DRAFT_153890 [Gamsiella multidivaricata]